MLPPWKLVHSPCFDLHGIKTWRGDSLLWQNVHTNFYDQKVWNVDITGCWSSRYSIFPFLQENWLKGNNYDLLDDSWERKHSVKLGIPVGIRTVHYSKWVGGVLHMRKEHLYHSCCFQWTGYSFSVLPIHVWNYSQIQ